VVFSGGEPLAELSLLLKLAEHAKRREMCSEVLTNAGLIASPESARKLISSEGDVQVLDMKPTEVISSMRRAGVQKIVISVDQYHNVAYSQSAGAVSMAAVEVAVRTCCEEGFGTPYRHLMIASVVDDYKASDPMLEELVRRLGLVPIADDCWRFEDSLIYYYAQPLQNQGRASVLKPWANLMPAECRSFHCPNSLPYTEEGGSRRLDMPSAGPVPHWLIKKLRNGDLRYQGWAHTVAVRYDGDVSTCGSHMFRIGNLDQAGLDEILCRANIGPWGSDKDVTHLALWCLLQHAPHDNGTLPLGNIGLAAQLIHDLLPKYRMSLTSKHAICRAIVSKPEIMRVLFEQWVCYLPSDIVKLVRGVIDAGALFFKSAGIGGQSER